MKTLLFKIIVLLTLLFTSLVDAQDFYGTATYESKISVKDAGLSEEQAKNLSDDIKKLIEEKIKSAMEQTFTLHFDRTTSLYEGVEKPQPLQTTPNMTFVTTTNQGQEKYYRNLKEKTILHESDISGKLFLIKDSLVKPAWKLGTETKKIGDYTCYKATLPIDASRVRTAGFTPTEENPTEITAWYTSEIPVAHGPDYFWGLPGLILELNDGTRTILCSKIVLNPKEKPEIKAPNKGKVVTGAEFQKILEKKMEEIQAEANSPENGRNTPRGGRNVQVKVIPLH